VGRCWFIDSSHKSAGREKQNHIHTMKTTTTTLLLSLLALFGTNRSHASADTFANATTIGINNNNSMETSLLNYTSEAGEPNHRPGGSVGAKKSAWWKWTAPANGFCTADTLYYANESFIFDTVLGVYTGSAVNALTRVAGNDDHRLTLSYSSAAGASTTFYATQGTTYYIAVDGYDPANVNANNHKVNLRVRFLSATTESRVGIFGNPSEPGLHGMVTVSKTSGHSFSGKLTLAGKAYPLAGVFSIDGYYIASIERKVPAGATPVPPLTLILDGAQNGSFRIATSQSFGADNPLAFVRRFTVAQPNTMKGLYTAGINAAGSLTLNVSSLGTTTGATVLPDGTKATFGAPLCTKSADSCYLPLYASLHLHTGFFAACLIATEAGAVDKLNLDIDSYSRYYRPEKVGAVFYPAGINTSLTINGSTYVTPVTGARALGFLDGSSGAGKLSILMQAGEISQAITENLILDSKNIIKFATPLLRKPVLNLNKANGLVTGSLLDDTGKKRNITGVLYNDGNTVKLNGHLTGTTYNPVFSVIP